MKVRKICVCLIISCLLNACGAVGISAMKFNPFKTDMIVFVNNYVTAVKHWIKMFHGRNSMQNNEQYSPITPKSDIVDCLYTDYGYWRNNKGLTADLVHRGRYMLEIPDSNGTEVWFEESDWDNAVLNGGDTVLQDYEPCFRMGGKVCELFDGVKSGMSESYFTEHLTQSKKCSNISCTRERGAGTMYYIANYYLSYTLTMYRNGRYNNMGFVVAADSNYNVYDDSYCWMYLLKDQAALDE